MVDIDETGKPTAQKRPGVLTDDEQNALYVKRQQRDLEMPSPLVNMRLNQMKLIKIPIRGITSMDITYLAACIETLHIEMLLIIEDRKQGKPEGDLLLKLQSVADNCNYTITRRWPHLFGIKYVD